MWVNYTAKEMSRVHAADIKAGPEILGYSELENLLGKSEEHIYLSPTPPPNMRFRHKPTVKADHYPLDQYPSISETPIAGHEPDGIPRNQEQVCQWGIGWKTTFILSGSYIMGMHMQYEPMWIFVLIYVESTCSSNHSSGSISLS